jgi:hypothetical protein
VGSRKKGKAAEGSVKHSFAYEGDLIRCVHCDATWEASQRGACGPAGTCTARAAELEVERLEQQWRDLRPGGHDLAWDRDPWGHLGCRSCGRRWLWKNVRVWVATVWQPCDPRDEGWRRREEEEFFAEYVGKKGQPGQHHVEYKDGEACCKECGKVAALHLWWRDFEKWECGGKGGRGGRERARAAAGGKGKGEEGGGRMQKGGDARSYGGSIRKVPGWKSGRGLTLVAPAVAPPRVRGSDQCKRARAKKAAEKGW